MNKRQRISMGVLTLCFLFLLAAPASAADSNPGGLTVAIALDSDGETVGAEAAVIARYMGGIYVDVPASLVSAQAAAYGVDINGTYYPMRPDSSLDGLAVARFTVDAPGNSPGVPETGSASKDEQVSLVYYYLSNDDLAVGTAKIQITDYLDIGGGVVLYDCRELESLDANYAFPMSAVNSSGQIVAYVSLTDSGTAVYTYSFDADKFSGGTSEPAPPAKQDRPAGSDDPAGSGRVSVDPDPDPDSNTILYAGIGAAAVAAAGLAFFFAHRKKGGGNAASADAGYPPIDVPPTAPADIPPTAPADVPPTVPSSQAPAALKKVSPVVYGEGGDMDGRRYVITQPTMTIGREISCNICYPAGTPGISHQHCVLAMRNGVLMLMDNGSTYGTYLRGTGKLAPQQPVALKDGDVFYLGEKKNAFRLTFE